MHRASAGRGLSIALEFHEKSPRAERSSHHLGRGAEHRAGGLIRSRGWSTYPPTNATPARSVNTRTFVWILPSARFISILPRGAGGGWRLMNRPLPSNSSGTCRSGRIHRSCLCWYQYRHKRCCIGSNPFRTRTHHYRTAFPRRKHCRTIRNACRRSTCRRRCRRNRSSRPDIRRRR